MSDDLERKVAEKITTNVIETKGFPSFMTTCSEAVVKVAE